MEMLFAFLIIFSSAFAQVETPKKVAFVLMRDLDPGTAFIVERTHTVWVHCADSGFVKIGQGFVELKAAECPKVWAAVQREIRHKRERAERIKNRRWVAAAILVGLGLATSLAITLEVHK